MRNYNPIITKGGDGVNNVPSEVKVELYVRARTIKEINRKIDIALMAEAMAVGAQAEISNTQGYLPVENNSQLKRNMLEKIYTIAIVHI